MVMFLPVGTTYPHFGLTFLLFTCFGQITTKPMPFTSVLYSKIDINVYNTGQEFGQDFRLKF